MALKISFPKVAGTVAVLLAATAISPAVSYAAERPVPPSVRVAPVAALQPLSTLIGSWNCTGSTTGPDGSQTAFETRSTAQFILNGNFMRWQETNSVDGVKIASAEYIWGWDAQQQHFTADRFDDAGQRGSQTTPGWAGTALTSTGVLVQTNGTSIPLTTTITKTAKNAFTVRAVVDLGGGVTVASASSCTR